MKTLVLAVAFVSNAWAAQAVLTMDEVAAQPINGLSITKTGFTFVFADTAGATYDTPNGGQMTYTQDPTIEGLSAGEVITVTFSLPALSIRFGMAQSTVQAAPVQLASVGLYNGATLLATRTFNSTLHDPFVEGQFAYSGELGPVTSIHITPAPGPGIAFAIDNLLVDTTQILPLTPAPRSLWLVLTGLLLVFGWSYWFQIRKRQSL